MVWIAFLICIVEVEKVAEKKLFIYSNFLFITTLYFSYLRVYTRGVATANQTSKGCFFCKYS